MKYKFYYHLESLRGIAATIIVLHHLKSLSPTLAQSDLMQNSSLAVDFFFVLSGFVVSLNYHNLLIKLDKVVLFIVLLFTGIQTHQFFPKFFLPVYEACCNL